MGKGVRSIILVGLALLLARNALSSCAFEKGQTVLAPVSSTKPIDGAQTKSAGLLYPGPTIKAVGQLVNIKKASYKKASEAIRRWSENKFVKRRQALNKILATIQADSYNEFLQHLANQANDCSTFVAPIVNLRLPNGKIEPGRTPEFLEEFGGKEIDPPKFYFWSFQGQTRWVNAPDAADPNTASQQSGKEACFSNAHRGFVLVRHELKKSGKDANSDENGKPEIFPFYSLYMHMAPTEWPYDSNDFFANVSWLRRFYHARNGAVVDLDPQGETWAT
jgi:hypothetical protein